MDQKNRRKTREWIKNYLEDVQVMSKKISQNSNESIRSEWKYQCMDHQ
jgi:hypothetical protein